MYFTGAHGPYAPFLAFIASYALLTGRAQLRVAALLWLDVCREDGRLGYGQGCIITIPTAESCVFSVAISSSEVIERMNL